ncbi:MAG TPA: YetF domain-containing protein [Thermoanaerobaculia bacterium]|nr:YetF domain-containing protein [Thermoanaerobaculia bacterium]
MEHVEAIWAAVQHLVGADLAPKDMTLGQIVLRALLIYVAGLVILRFGEHRFLGKHTAFDIVLGFILGSVLSRAVNGSAPLLGTMVAAALLVALHWLFALGAFRSHTFGSLIKGNPHRLVADGRVDWPAMRSKRISRRDLEEALRLRANRADLDDVDEAYFERSGDISFVPRRKGGGGGGEPRVIEVRVEDGVQTVRIELG